MQRYPDRRSPVRISSDGTILEKISLRLPAADKRVIEAVAREESLSINELLKVWIEPYLGERRAG